LPILWLSRTRPLPQRQFLKRQFLFLRDRPNRALPLPNQPKICVRCPSYYAASRHRERAAIRSSALSRRGAARWHAVAVIGRCTMIVSLNRPHT
jgi:hypothetical protein